MLGATRARTCTQMIMERDSAAGGRVCAGQWFHQPRGSPANYRALGHLWGSCGISFIPLSDSVCLRDLVPYLVNYLYCF